MSASTSPTPPPVVTHSVKPRADGAPGLHFIEAFTWIFESPKWLVNLLLTTLLMTMLPVIGPMVVTGYMLECLEQEVRSPHFGYRDFDLNRFIELLKRGCGLTLIKFALGIGSAILTNLFYFPIFLTAINFLQTNEPLSMMIGGLILTLCYLFLFLVSLLMSALPIPIALRVGLSRNWREALHLRWHLRFLYKTAPELVVCGVVMSLATFTFSLFGILACFFGLYVVVALLEFAGYRITLQLYEIFLARGGEPIPLPPLPAAPEAPQKNSSPFMPAPG